jgi:hypothetical protein
MVRSLLLLIKKTALETHHATSRRRPPKSLK